MNRLILTLVFAFATAASASADILHLMNGGSVEGKVTRTEDGYRVETATGTIRLRNDQVRYWQKKLLPEEEYQARAGEVKSTDFDGHVDLAKWCRKKGMTGQARWHYMIAVGLKPDNAQARRGAGYVKDQGRWVLYDDYMTAKGMVKYKGDWLKKEEADRRRKADQEKMEREQAYKEVWKILYQASKEKRDASLTGHIKVIAERGAYAQGALHRGSNDSSERMRELVLICLGKLDTEESLNTLKGRLTIERDPLLVHAICRQLALRTDRMAVMTAILDMTINHRNRLVRKRTWMALDYLGDKRAIDSLVPLSEQAIKPRLQIMEEGNAEKGDPEVSVGERKKPYYPAHEALCYLSGLSYPPRLELWSQWWNRKREKFVFRHAVKNRQPQQPKESKPE